MRGAERVVLAGQHLVYRSIDSRLLSMVNERPQAKATSAISRSCTDFSSAACATCSAALAARVA